MLFPKSVKGDLIPGSPTTIRFSLCACFKYSINETKRIKYLKLIDNKKKQTILNSKSIKNYESELCEYNSKTLDVDNFNIYANLKIKLRKLIATTCIYNEHIKKLKWHGYINKKRHEDNLLNDLEHLYGSNAIFVLGDWSNSNGIKHISTPNMSMKKLLLKRFEVYLIDEFNTSKLHYVSEEKCEKIKIRITHKSGKIESRELHSVLTFKMSNRKVCINRDYNACLNIMKSYCVVDFTTLYNLQIFYFLKIFFC